MALRTATLDEVFRSGCTFHRGHGRIFYFGPVQETFPIYRQAEELKVPGNAVRRAAPPVVRTTVKAPGFDALERLA